MEGSAKARRRGRLGLVLGLTLSTLACAAVAYADNAISDGDGVTPVTNQNMSFGAVSCATPTSKSALVAVTRNGAAGSTNVFKDSSTVTVSVQSVTGAGLTASVGAPGTITLPANWGTLDNNTLTSALTSLVTVNSTTPGAGTGTVVYQAQGSNSSNATITRTDTMDVSWTTGSCAPTDGTAPAGSVVIDGNALYTSSTSVDLDLSATDAVGVTSYRVANGSDCSAATWVAVAPTTNLAQTIPHTLGAGDGAKTVCAQYGDAAGNVSATATDTIVLDTLAPVIQDAGVQSGTAGANGWYVSAVTNRFTASDAGSGLDPGCAAAFPKNVSTGSSEGTTVTVSSGACSDLAGNTNPGISSASFEIDLTDPTAILAVTAGTPGTHGWYVSDVTVTTSGAETVSGPLSCTAAQQQTAETNGAVFNGSCTNQAGRSATATPLTVKLDKTGPSAALAVTAGTLGAHGWYTSDVTVSTSGSDSVSGPVVCTADQQQTDETSGQALTGSCTNDAGITTDAAPLTVKLDKTGPSATLAVTAGALGANGWYTSDVTIETTGVDTISGPVTCTGDQHQTIETVGQTFTGSCVNQAGLAGNAAPLTVKLDKTAPSATLTASGSQGTNGWFLDDVTVKTTGADTISGPVTCTPDQLQTAETAGQSFNGACTNHAGLIGNATSLVVKLDKTNPSVAITAPAGGSTTIATAVTVSGTDGDATSGIAGVTVNGVPATLGSGTFTKTGIALACGSNTLTAVATDQAGRTSTDSIAITRQCFGLQFLQPLDQSTTAPIMNKGKYGRVIPVKVLLSLTGGTTLGSSVLANNGWTLQMGVNGASCSTGAGTDEIEAYADAGASAAGSNLFRWDSSAGQWIYNLDTKAPPGMTMTVGSCYRLDVYVSDGSNKVVLSTVTYAVFQPTK
jgi:hypothetical protein